MPTYEYTCRECGEHLEVVQSFKDDALTDCPACERAGTLRKVFSAAGIIFKGSGWHIKDYSAAKDAGRSGGDTGSSSGDTGSGKGDAGKGGTDKAGGKTDGGTPGSGTSGAGTSGSGTSGSGTSSSGTGASEAKSA